MRQWPHNVLRLVLHYQCGNGYHRHGRYCRYCRARTGAGERPKRIDLHAPSLLPHNHAAGKTESMKYRLAIFDFDGTLADSFPFFASVFNLLADTHDFRRIQSCEAQALRQLTPRQLMRHVGLPAWKLPLVSKSFIAMMKQNAAGIALFEGVGEALRHLADNGVCLSIVSSNSRENIDRVLGPDIAKLIRHVECGMSIFGKQARIQRLMRKADVAGNEAIYIGDQTTDMEAARKAGVACGAVSWGYGAIESLRMHAPEEEFDRVADLMRLA